MRVSFRSCEYKCRYLCHHVYFWLQNHVSVAARVVESNQYRGFRSEQLTVSSREDKIGIHTRGVTSVNPFQTLFRCTSLPSPDLRRSSAEKYF